MKRFAALLLTAIGIALLVWLVWREVKPATLGNAFASGNGRIEATEIDVATKLAGRVIE